MSSNLFLKDQIVEKIINKKITTKYPKPGLKNSNGKDNVVIILFN
jgi:hypothetical protein